jgi:transcriptional regulator with XRE-family HTH domain
MTLEQEIGRRIAAYRARTGMTQTRLGERIATQLGRPWTRKSVMAAEQGNRVFTAAEMVAFSKLLNVPIQTLFELPECQACADAPPVGFTCNECGAVGQREAS